MRALVLALLLLFATLLVRADEFILIPAAGGGGCTDVNYTEGFGGSGEISTISNWSKINSVTNTITQSGGQAVWTKSGTGFQSTSIYQYAPPSATCSANVAGYVQIVDNALGAVRFGFRLDGSDDGYSVTVEGTTPELRAYSFDTATSIELIDNTCAESFTETFDANDYRGVIVTGTTTVTAVVYDFDTTVPDANPANWASQAASGGVCTLSGNPTTPINGVGDFAFGLGGNTGSPWQVDNLRFGDD